MAIGTAAAIGLGVAGVGSVLGAKSQSKAAGKAADVSAQTARENNALAREIYGKNEGYLAPYANQGLAASGQINALLGIGGGMQAPPVAQPQMQQPAQQGANDLPGGKFPGPLRHDWNGDGRISFGDVSAYWDFRNAPQPTTAAPQVVQPQQTSPQAAANAFDQFRGSTGYQFRLNEGMNALNNGYAGAGVVQSGAAMKAAQRYGQDVASDEFGRYLGYLGNQQSVGLSGASALAGVGQNHVNTISANNNSAGTAAANALLVKGANNPFANTLSLLGGGLYGLKS